MQIIKGITGLLQSRKGTLSLIITASITYLCAAGKIDGTSFAAVVAVVQLIFCYSQAKIDQQSMKIIGDSRNYDRSVLETTVTSTDPNTTTITSMTPTIGRVSTTIQEMKDKADKLLNNPIK